MGKQGQPKSKRKRSRKSDLKDPRCPYCGFKLMGVPEKPGICPECKNKVYVHHKQQILDRIILTRDDAQLISRFIKLAGQKKLSEKDYHNKRRELRKALGTDPDPEDVLSILENPAMEEILIQDNLSLDDSVDGSTAFGFTDASFEASDSMIRGISDEIQAIEERDGNEDSTPTPVNAKAGNPNEDTGFLDTGELPGAGAGDSMLGIHIPADGPANTKPQKEQSSNRAIDGDEFSMQCMKLLAKLGIKREDIPRHEMLVEATLGHTPRVIEVLRSLFEETTMKRHDNYEEAATNYHALAVLFHNQGYRSFPIQEHGTKMLLLHMRETDVEEVELLCPDRSCDEYGNLDGKIIPLEMAMRSMPLPVEKSGKRLGKSAKYDFCTGEYIPIDSGGSDFDLETDISDRTNFNMFIDSLGASDTQLPEITEAMLSDIEEEDEANSTPSPAKSKPTKEKDDDGPIELV